jgi:hypothetical protein
VVAVSFDYSDDCEMIELILPGTFETREL